MSNSELPIVWHLDAAKIKVYHHSPADRLTLIKYIMHLFENGVISLDQAKLSFEKICGNEKTDKEINYLLDKIRINSETRIDDIFECLGLKDKSKES